MIHVLPIGATRFDRAEGTRYPSVARIRNRFTCDALYGKGLI